MSAFGAGRNCIDLTGEDGDLDVPSRSADSTGPQPHASHDFHHGGNGSMGGRQSDRSGDDTSASTCEAVGGVKRRRSPSLEAGGDVGLPDTKGDDPIWSSRLAGAKANGAHGSHNRHIHGDAGISGLDSRPVVAHGHRFRHASMTLETDASTPLSADTSNASGNTAIKWRPYYLLRTPRLTEGCNVNSITIHDIMHGEFRSALIMNYMIDMSWLICSVPRLTDPNVAVCCVHGEKGGALASTIVSMGLYNWSCSEADLGPERFGTHHSKMIIMRYDTGVRVVIMTANLIEDDFDYRTQGVFIQDFPLKSGHDPPPRASSRGDGSGASVPLSHSNRALAFKHDLVDYLNHVAVKGADTQAALRSHTTMLDRYDFSGAEVCIVASVPGRHAASAAKWGHLKLRRCLQTALKTTDGNGTSGCSSGGGGGVGHIACQYSSTGSMGKGEVYLDELKESFSATAASSNSGSTLSLHRGAVRMELIWPTVECVRSSLQGYASGGSLPCNVASIYDVDERGGRPLRIKEGFARLLHKWEGAPPARHAATPHIKSFCRYRERSEGIGVDLDWFLLTSKNLSQAAWGVLQTNKTKLYIKSYEIGVLFIRGEVKTNRRLFSCTPKHPVLGLDCTDMSGCDSAAVMSDSGCTMGVMISDRHDGDAPDITFDIPYKLPPCKYTLGPGVGGTSAEVDVPWCWDRVYATPDRFGNKWTGGV